VRPAIFTSEQRGQEVPDIPQVALQQDVDGFKKPPIYGYMRAYEGTPEAEITRDELRMFRWAQVEGYDLAVIYQEEQEGSIAVLTDLIRELKVNGDAAVVVPSMEHFGTSRVLREHLAAYLVHSADVDVHEASDR
jgi:hypothetical protein